MTFTYPAVITPHKDDDGFHIVFPDLELCEGDGPDLEDALDDAREAAYNWLMLELEEDRKSTRLNSSHPSRSRMPSSA